VITAPSIDVSKLPHQVLGHRSPIWWGNLWLLVIETTIFALLVAVYFYLRVVDFNQWPPPRVNQTPILYHPYPLLGISTVNLAVILLSLAPMFWVDRACLKRKLSAVRIGLVISVLFGVAAVVLRFQEFQGIQFKWSDNAYASIVWIILGMHLAHLITGTCENAIMTLWIFAKGMDDKHARDIRVTGVYWYWIVGIWVLLYILVYCVPRWI
jgi:heme/copper-type cytochrome/quinol oxidase subunit 3